MSYESPYRLRHVVRRHAAGFVFGALLAIVTVGIQLGLPFIVSHLIDALTDGTLTPTGLLRGVMLYVACIPVAVGVSYWMRRLPLRAAHTVEYAVRRDLFAHLTRQDADFFRRERIGDLMTRLNSDLTVVRDALGHGVLHGTRSLFSMLLAFGVLFRLQAGMALLLLSMMLGMVMTFSFVLRAIRRRHSNLQEQNSNLAHTVEESFSGIRTIKGFALEARRRQRFALENQTLRRRAMALSWISEPIWPLFAFWFALQLVVALVYGGRLVLQEKISLGELVLVNQYLLFLQWPVLSLGWIGNLTQRARTSWQRLYALFATAPLIADSDDTDPAIRSLRGDIALRNVCLRLGGQTVLDNINLSIPAGSTLGITGPTGSGKTLLLSLVARLRDPDAGTVVIDGHPLPTIPLDVLHRHIGMAAQEPVLFSDTLARNLAFGLDVSRDVLKDGADAEAETETVRHAATVAHLESDIERFPMGYETRVGERGVTLSGGQRQRVALGRAVARNPAVLLLDDVLAAVDTQTEAAILEQLMPVMRSRTTLVVSHRLSALYQADRIVVLIDGKIAEQGTHAELLAHGGYYATTYRLQQIETEDA